MSEKEYTKEKRAKISSKSSNSMKCTTNSYAVQNTLPPYGRAHRIIAPPKERKRFEKPKRITHNYTCALFSRHYYTLFIHTNMRLHKVYHRASLVHLPKQPFLLSSSLPHFLSLKPPPRPPLQFNKPYSSTSPAAVWARAMRFRSIVINAAENDGSTNGVTHSSAATADYEGSS